MPSIVVRPPSPELAAKQQQAAAAAKNMSVALQRKERAAALEIESIAGQMRTLLAKIEADPPQSTAAVNKWWEILCDSRVINEHASTPSTRHRPHRYQMNLADGALLNETAWSALVGMSKKNARDAAKAELAAE